MLGISLESIAASIVWGSGLLDADISATRSRKTHPIRLQLCPPNAEATPFTIYREPDTRLLVTLLALFYFIIIVVADWSAQYFKSVTFDSARSNARGRQGSGPDLVEESEREQSQRSRTSPAPTLFTYTSPDHLSSSRPGSSAWLVDLVLAALRPNCNLLIRQLALTALRALTFGDRTWREVNGALLEKIEKGIADVETMLQNRESIDPHAAGDANAEAGPAIASAWIGRKLPIQQRPFGLGSSLTSFIIAPEDYEHDTPPRLVDAPPHCLFCIPRKDQDDADDPYRMWILNDDMSWQPISLHAPHPDPSEHPYMLKIRVSDKTPSWVLPESLTREGRRTPRKPNITTSATIAGPSPSATVAGPSSSATESRTNTAKKSDTTPTKLRYRQSLRFSEPKGQEDAGKPINASAGSSRR
ncbi:unnamed protein product [Peniophora sp. CBMAI 1063]|nr:unnamed protein product [Peniophora sp. CBMAI 1063]